MSAPLAPAAAADRGHTLTWNPPAELAANANRWTCSECGGAALEFRGTVFGSATERDCDEEKAAMSQYTP